VEIYGLPVALVALIFVFGSLVAAALPVITGGLAVTVTLGPCTDAKVTSMSIFSMNVATLLGLAVAIDYALFIVWRFREELHRGASVRDAVVVTTARAGRSVFFSGAAVLVGVIGLVFFPSPASARSHWRCARRSHVCGCVDNLHARAARGIGSQGQLNPGRRLHEAHNGRVAVVGQGAAAAALGIDLGCAGADCAAGGAALTMKTQMTTAKTLPPAAESRQGSKSWIENSTERRCRRSPCCSRGREMARSTSTAPSPCSPTDSSFSRPRTSSRCSVRSR